MSTLEDTLRDLHSATIHLLLKRITDGEATAADLSVARQLLKDNGIDAAVQKGDSLDALGKAMNLPDLDDQENVHRFPR